MSNMLFVMKSLVQKLSVSLKALCTVETGKVKQHTLFHVEIKCNNNGHFCIKLVRKHSFVGAGGREARTRSSLECVSGRNWLPTM